jgi:hypothetical protein
MKSLGPYLDEAIPHEAGHMLVGKVVGFPPEGLDIEVVRDPKGLSIGNLATLGIEPTDEAIPKMSPEARAAFMLFVAGGVAGNRFCGLSIVGEGADSDRRTLARITDKPLEEIAILAVAIIETRKRLFRRLVSVIRERLAALMKNSNLQTGRHTLLTEEDLDDIFGRP